jgi:orotate phosphoribosyltransferase
MNTAEQLADYLLSIEAVRLQPEKPFTWASGWKSPIYCDNRLSLSFPEIRGYIRDALVSTIVKEFPGVEVIAGVATAGIPQGALVADVLSLPFCYVRPKPKDHGMENLIEGLLPVGKKVVLIEDLISTGGSSLKAAQALKDKGAEVIGMAAIFTYDFPEAAEAFRNAGIPLKSLSAYPVLLEIAIQKGYVKAELLPTLEAWRKAPHAWQGI